MRSTIRIALVFALLLVPTLSYAQQTQQTFTQTIPGVSSQSSQFFSGGVSVVPGAMFGIGGGMYGIGGVAAKVLYIINTVLVPLLFAVAFIVFLYGIAKAYIFSAGDEEAIKNGHKIILWGLIAFAVMVSVWGLVNVVVNTFGLASFAPRGPSSYSPFMGAPPLPPR